MHNEWVWSTKSKQPNSGYFRRLKWPAFNIIWVPFLCHWNIARAKIWMLLRIDKNELYSYNNFNQVRTIKRDNSIRKNCIYWCQNKPKPQKLYRLFILMFICAKQRIKPKHLISLHSNKKSRIVAVHHKIYDLGIAIATSYFACFCWI